MSSSSLFGFLSVRFGVGNTALEMLWSCDKALATISCTWLYPTVWLSACSLFRVSGLYGRMLRLNLLIVEGSCDVGWSWFVIVIACFIMIVSGMKLHAYGIRHPSIQFIVKILSTVRCFLCVVVDSMNGIILPKPMDLVTSLLFVTSVQLRIVVSFELK